jgi:hypothetical protein
MFWLEVLDGLGFDDDLFLDEGVNPVAAVNPRLSLITARFSAAQRPGRAA